MQIIVINHSHTDIGYTDYQEKLEADHADYTRQAVEILKAIDAGELPGCEGYVWQCENHWQVENFCKNAQNHEIADFEAYVRSGRIGLSGNYLNLTELIDDHTLRAHLNAGRDWARARRLRLTSAMSADINGYAWGYPDALKEAGVDSLFCALHSHHGMFPMGHNPSCFYWRGPKGGRVLTFVGEHYHFGNELGFAPRAGTDYMLFDDVREARARRELFASDPEQADAIELDALIKRLTRYLESLQEIDYPFDTVPIMVSGVITDNAPPAAAIALRVREADRRMGDGVSIRMGTLDDFFDAIRAEGKEIPTFEGDFTDWWADGVGSTPAAVKVYRSAQRLSRTARRLDPEGKLGSAELVHEAERNMMLYAEHTWGYSTSISEPWNSMVSAVGLRKTQYAVAADVAANRNLLKIKSALGAVSPRAGRPYRARILNPNEFAVTDAATVILDHWGTIREMPIQAYKGFQAIDLTTGRALPTQCRPSSRGLAVETVVTLPAHGSMDVEIVPDDCANTSSMRHTPYIGAEGVRDFAGTPNAETPFGIETDAWSVRFAAGDGIVSIVDRKSGRELVMPGVCGAFTGVYEVTPGDDKGLLDVRRRMGRNRSSISTERDIARMTDARIVESGPVYATARLSYSLKGMNFYEVFLKVYKVMPRIEARVCLHKVSALEPENVYVALPFTAGGQNETYIDKTGCALRPAIDQLPGTCQMFYLGQNGAVRRGEALDLLIGMKDTPLTVFGPRAAEPVQLFDGPNAALNGAEMYSWAMNNFWETNFEADLGGVYEFTYTLTTAEPSQPEETMRRIEAINDGLVVMDI